MSLHWADFKRILAGRRLPAAIVDLDALDANTDSLGARMGPAPAQTLRIASKSVRHTGLLRRILERGGQRFRGLMCFAAEELCFLADAGFDDLLLAYPTVQPDPLERAAAHAKAGRTLWLIADSREHLEAIGRAGRAVGVELAAVLELDVSYRPLGGRVHIGARRSPIRSVEDALAVAALSSTIEGVRVAGVMGYEAHVAGVQDANPFNPTLNPVKRALKQLAVPAVRDLRTRTIEALRGAGHTIELVNGGGTGSIETTCAEPHVTEVAAGSGFVNSHLFDYFSHFDLQPAAYFALEACRVSDPGYITCAGGGYIASGEPGWDRLPLPVEPPGLQYVKMEGAGEVQTPLLLPADGPPIALGDPIVFRHAKAGELAERFNEYLLIRGGTVEGAEPTYRGEGQCFL
jgi:D-serine deaminase-like pyridoxal phosphate-dependent protein